MTFHSRVYRPAKGTARTNELGHRLSPRIAVCLPDDEFDEVSRLAEEQGVPMAEIIRKAVRAYVEARR